MMRFLAIPVLALGLAGGLFGPAQPAQAHGLDNSLVSVELLPGHQLKVSVQININDAFTHFEMDADHDGRIGSDDINAALPRTYDFLEAAVRLTADGQPVLLRRPEGPLRRRITSTGDTPLLAHDFTGSLAREPDAITLTLAPEYFQAFGDQHRVLVKLTAGERTAEAVCSQGDPDETFPVATPAPLPEQLKHFVVLGIEHIFLGYDHIMFLLALILVGGRFLELVKIVTAFTVAHSVTLILAALRIVTLPSRLIESAIALSIAYVAAENLFRARLEKRWMLTFAFGLVHGFGFANVLRELGLPAKGLVLSLLGFNLGVEIGQVCIVGALFPLILWLHRQPETRRRRIVTALSVGILLFGLGWLVERVVGLEFMPI